MKESKMLQHGVINRAEVFIFSREKSYICAPQACYIAVVIRQRKEEVDLSVNLPGTRRVLIDKEREIPCNNSMIQCFKRNELIYCEGDEPKDIMCSLEDKVKIYKDGVDDRSQIIQMIKSVRHLGYRASFTQEDYLTNASIFEAPTVCMTPMIVVTGLLVSSPNLAVSLIRQLSVDLGVSDERTTNLTQKCIRGRLAESLLFPKNSCGLEEDGAMLSIYLAREDLANLFNMITLNAVHILSTLAAERIIALDGRKIKSTDEDRLKKISKMG